MDSDNSAALFLIVGGTLLTVVGLLNKKFRSRITAWNDKAYDRLGVTSGSTGGSVKMGGIFVLVVGVVMLLGGLVLLISR